MKELQSEIPQPEPSYPYFFYTVTAQIKFKGYKDKHITAIIRTNRYGDIKRTLEKLLEKSLKDVNWWLGTVDARKLKSDFIVLDTQQYLSEPVTA